MVASIAFDSSRYHEPSSNWMCGYFRWPVPPKTSLCLALLDGPGTRSYSMPMSMSAFSTFQHGCPLIFTHCCEQRCNLTAIGSSLLGSEERQLGLALAAEYLQIDCRTSDAARLGQRNRLR